VYLASPYVHPIFGVLLGCLASLHCYWFVLCVRILLTFLRTGRSEDTVNRTTAATAAGYQAKNNFLQEQSDKINIKED
jgi:hypothetical protein